nr:hypothetical protein [uncultured Rhodopila sp.]
MSRLPGAPAPASPRARRRPGGHGGSEMLHARHDNGCSGLGAAATFLKA